MAIKLQVSRVFRELRKPAVYRGLSLVTRQSIHQAYTAYKDLEPRTRDLCWEAFRQAADEMTGHSLWSVGGQGYRAMNALSTVISMSPSAPSDEQSDQTPE